MLCNNANARRCSYFELGLPVVSLINPCLAIFVFSVSSEEVRVYNKSEQSDEKNKQTNKQTKRKNKQTSTQNHHSLTRITILPFTCLLFVNQILNNDDRNCLLTRNFLLCRTVYFFGVYILNLLSYEMI